MATFLKEPNPPTVEATDELQSRVAAMLRDIEEGGIDAVRRYSRDLDGWDPESFVVSDAEFERVSDELDPALKEHIAFAQTQVRTFAQAQRDTLTDLRVEMGPGSCSAIATSPSAPWARTSRAAVTRCSRRRS